ncbi:hypothetical protein [Gemmatimonas phototrophica]|uniref:hypothetical protein n=1 Tax=Gemmatimonas phototrophica TaxID=1379270 RepID=UPI0011AE48CF|nr:hypothetical protein [Gemmatimonas phototrophica]
MFRFTWTALVFGAVLSGCASTSTPRPTDLTTPRPTRVVTHVVTHDAKLIGSAVGGVRVTIRDVTTDRILAEGQHDGGTGDTKRIMQDLRKRGDTLFAATGGARYEATVAIAAPTLVDISAEGPLGYPDQLTRASKRLLLFPGRDVGGDGIVLELHGYVIDLMGPDTTQALPASSALRVRARVRMLCSCPTQPGGMWEVRDVVARLVRNGVVVREGALTYGGESSIYTGELAPVESGVYQLEVLAANPGAATFGIVRRRVTIVR